MNTIHRIHHLITILAAGACALLAFAAAAPAAVAGTNDDARRKSPELLGGIPHSVGHQTT